MTTPTPVETPTPPNEPAPATPPASPEPKLMNEEQVNQVVKDRLARQRAQFPSDEELKALKERAGRLDQIEEQQKTELEKAQQRASELEKQAADATTRAQEASLRSAIVAEAARKNVVDPDAAVALLDRSALEFGEDGAPTNIADAMDALLKAKTYLVGGGNGRADLGARTGNEGQLSRDDLKTMTDAQILEARNKGLLGDLGA